MSGVLGGFLRTSATKQRRADHLVVDVKTTLSSKEYMTPNQRLCEKVKVAFRRGKSRLAREITDGNNKNGLEVRTKLRKILKPESFEGGKVSENNFIRIHDWATIVEAHRHLLNEDELRESRLGAIIDSGLLPKLRTNAAREVSTLFGCYFDADGNYILSKEVKARIRYGIGLFFRDLFYRLNEAQTQKSKRDKIYLYAGHDTTLVPLLIGLDIFDSNWPGYCAELALELWESGDADDTDDGEAASEETDVITIPDLESQLDKPSVSTGGAIDRYRVRILYNGEVKKNMTLAEFNQQYSDIVPFDPKEWASECRLISKEEQAKLRAVGSEALSF